MADIKHSVFSVVNVAKTNEWICKDSVYPADSWWREKEAKYYLTESVNQTHFSVADLAGSQSPLDSRTWLVQAFRNMDSAQMQAWICSELNVTRTYSSLARRGRLLMDIMIRPSWSTDRS